MFKRFLSFALAVLMCAVMFIGCTNDTADEIVDDTTPVETTPVETLPPVVDVSVAADGVCDYVVIRPDDGNKYAARNGEITIEL